MTAVPADPRDRREPDDKVVVREWSGWVPNADPHSLPPGASPSANNVTSVRPGEMTVRMGAKLVKFT